MVVVIRTKNGVWRKIGGVWVLLPAPVDPSGPVVAQIHRDVGEPLLLEVQRPPDFGLVVRVMASVDDRMELASIGDDRQELLSAIAETVDDELSSTDLDDTVEPDES